VFLEQGLHPVERAHDADWHEAGGIRLDLLDQEGVRREVRVGEVELHLLHDLVHLLVGERLEGLLLLLFFSGASAALGGGSSGRRPRVASRGRIPHGEIRQRVDRIVDHGRIVGFRLAGHPSRVRSCQWARRRRSAVFAFR
jgi:hypothetical protein